MLHFFKKESDSWIIEMNTPVSLEWIANVKNKCSETMNGNKVCQREFEGIHPRLLEPTCTFVKNVQLKGKKKKHPH